MRYSKQIKRAVVQTAVIGLVSSACATSYYVDQQAGNDSNPGTWLSPWKTLAQAQAQTYVAGDELCLSRGSVFNGNLKIKKLFATAANPFTIRAYGSGNDPVIDSRGYTRGIHLFNCSGIIVKDIEITSDQDNGTVYESGAASDRYGVYVETLTNQWNSITNYSSILLENLHVHDIFASDATVNTSSKAGTFHAGNGIHILADYGTVLQDVVVSNCVVEQTGRYGIQLKGKKDTEGRSLQYVEILDSKMMKTGGSGMQGSNVFDWLVSGNTVTNSGWYRSASVPSFGRGSGIWPFSCQTVRIADNRFLSARGKGDSCGAHIDFNNNDVVVEYNFSYDNEGGFCEILGNCTNSVYRYNVSVNDGWRVKGQNGAEQEGKVLWLSGYVGSGTTKKGPFFTYIYNNTIYVNKGSQAVFAITPTAAGIRIENNIFYIPSSISTVNGSDDQDSTGIPSGAQVSNVKFRGNLYNRSGIIPAALPIQDSDPTIADPQFPNPGKIWPYAYIPGNTAVVQDAGRRVWKLSGDPLYIWTDLQVHTDMMGNYVANTSSDLPDLGAMELQP